MRMTPPASPPMPSKRGATLASGPLGLIAIAFVMPFADQCGTGHMDHPYEAVGDPFIASWALAPFLVAGVLAAITWAALVDRRPPAKWGQRVALLGLVLDAIGHVTWAVTYVTSKSLNRQDHAHLIWMALTAPVGVGFAISALRKRDWDRWLRIIAAHTALSAHICFFAVSAKGIGSGGYLYMASIAALALIVLWAMVAERRRNPTTR